MKRFEIVVGDADDVMFRTDDRQDAIQWFIVWTLRFRGRVALRTDGLIERVRLKAPATFNDPEDGDIPIGGELDEGGLMVDDEGEEPSVEAAAPQHRADRVSGNT